MILKTDLMQVALKQHLEQLIKENKKVSLKKVLSDNFVEFLCLFKEDVRKHVQIEPHEIFNLFDVYIQMNGMPCWKKIIQSSDEILQKYTHYNQNAEKHLENEHFIQSLYKLWYHSSNFNFSMNISVETITIY